MEFPPPDGSLMAIAQQIFAGNEYELNFRLDASNVGASVAYLASIIYAMKNNQTPSGLVLILMLLTNVLQHILI